MHYISTKTEGKWHTNDNIRAVLNEAEDGEYLVSIFPLRPQSDLSTYRKAYFAELSFLANEVGESKHDMHEHIKSELLEGQSTTTLDEEGWLLLMNKLEYWVWGTYGIILP